MSNLKFVTTLSLLAGLALPLAAQAGVVPTGIQAGVSAATVTGWGWKECHRSVANSATSISGVLDTCQGTHLMMGYASTAGQYDILGAGTYAAVTAVTYADSSSDNNGTTLDNWSNGLNFYRTAGTGSWGFTTNTKTELNSADIFLLNGLQQQNGQVEGELSKGLSFHVYNGNLSAGWVYNITGSNEMPMMSGDRVFLSYTEQSADVPEPGILMLIGIGLAGAGLARRRKV